ALASWWSSSDHAPLAQNNPYATLTRASKGNAFDMEFGGRGGRMDRLEMLQNRAEGIPMAAGAPRDLARKAAGDDKAGEAKFRQQGQANGAAEDSKAAGTGGSPAPARVREYFPETMLWQPNLITDENGIADLAVNFADSITTWRLSASANSRTGALGGTT